jgi:hypothetical protein
VDRAPFGFFSLISDVWMVYPCFQEQSPAVWELQCDWYLRNIGGRAHRDKGGIRILGNGKEIEIMEAVLVADASPVKGSG